jgi:hypothetical protein
VSVRCNLGPLAAGLALLVATAGCKPTPPPARAAVVVLVDLSGSVRKPEMIHLYERSFDAAVQQLAPGDVLLVAPVTAASEMTLDLPIREELPAPKPPNDNPAVVKRLREQAARKLKARLPDIEKRFRAWLEQPDRKILNTDLFGAFSIAQRLFASYPERPAKVLVVLSDMVQDSPAHNFTHERLSSGRTKTLLAALRDAGQLPQLDRAQVHVVGASAGNSARFHSIRDFWLAYFKAAGATLRPEDYGAAMVRFRISRGGGPG